MYNEIKIIIKYNITFKFINDNEISKEIYDKITNNLKKNIKHGEYKYE